MSEENKLVQRKRRALSNGQLSAYEAAINALGDHYANAGQHGQALAIYTEACTEFSRTHGPFSVGGGGCRMQLGRAHRMCGEMHMLLEDYTAAATHVDKFLRIAQQQTNRVEEQRAYATIGRLHLLHGQSVVAESPSATESPGATTKAAAAILRRAESAFQRSLEVSRDLPDTAIPRLERIDMQARLQLNLGVTHECLGNWAATEEHMERALQLCRDNGLHELLHQCYVTTASFVFSKRGDTTKALRLLSLALTLAAERLDKRRRCETLLVQADIFVRGADWQSARQSLLRAHRLRSPVEADRKQVEQQLRTVVAIGRAEDALVMAAATDWPERRRLFEVLGDGACQMRNFEKALEYYGLQLQSAEKAFVSERELAPCFVSLYQTCLDLGRHEEALVYLRKEYELVRVAQPREAVATLLNIADALVAAGKEFWAVDEVLQEARGQAKRLATRRMETVIVRRMVRLRREHKMLTLVEVLRDEAAREGLSLGAVDGQEEEEDEEDEEAGDVAERDSEKNTMEIGGDIDLDELSGSDEDEDNNANNSNPSSTPATTTGAHSANRSAAAPADQPAAGRRPNRRLGAIGTVRRNEKGETGLHSACIAGNLAQVRRLLDAGHPVNVRDFAGWQPLHEAANHGHLDIVQLLLERGAWINDRGGKMCDGVTALHDACGNGCLEVAEALLEAGANATMRTDLCETPVDTLEKWRRQQAAGSLDAAEQAMYERLRRRLLQQLERTGGSRQQQQQASELLSAEEGVRQRRREAQRSGGSTGTAKGKRSQADSQPERRTIDTILADEFCSQRPDGISAAAISAMEQERGEDLDSNGSLSPPPPRITAGAGDDDDGSDACSDYRNVMAALRHNPSPLKRNSSFGGGGGGGSHNESAKRRLAGILDSDEVGENWLENDLERAAGSMPAKKAKTLTLGSGSSSSTSAANRYIPRSKENAQPNQRRMRLSGSSSLSSASGFNGFSSGSSASSTQQSDAYSSSAPNVDAFDVMMQPGNSAVSSSTVIRPARRRSGCTGAATASGSGQRNSLLHAGFVQFKRAAKAVPVDSDDEHEVSSTRADTTAMEVVVNAATAAIPKLMAGTTFKVRVGEQLLNVPVNNEMIADLTIGWLAEETARRYYNLKGLQPVLEITSSDGAAFERSDPLAVVIGTTIGSNVLEWILPSVAQRYMEACRQLQTVPDDHIKSTLELIQATHQLQLTDQPPLRSELCRPLCRAIHHQTNIDTIDLSRVALDDDGLRHLVDALHTIRPKRLLLAGNQITGDGLGYLSKKLAASSGTSPPSALTNPATQTPLATGTFLADLQQLDLSFNPLDGSDPADLRTILGHCPQLRALRLRSVGLREMPASAERLIALTELDIGHNPQFGSVALRRLLPQLNACKMASLRLGFLDTGGGSWSAWAQQLAEWLQTGTLEALRVLDVSGWQLDDGDVYEVVQALRRAPQLSELWALGNQRMGGIACGQLVGGGLRVGRVYLDGCGTGWLRHLAAGTSGAGSAGRPAEAGTAASSSATAGCSWWRMARVTDEREMQGLRDFWTQLHGARARIAFKRTHTVLDVIEVN